MAVYHITFRIDEAGNSNARRDELYAYLLQGTSQHWKDPTSFLIIEDDADIDAVAYAAKQTIDEDVDLVFIKEDGMKRARVVGRVEDQDLFNLIPYCKRA